MSSQEHSDNEVGDEEFDLVEDEDSEQFQCQACAKGFLRPCILACGHRLCACCLASHCPLPGCGQPVCGYAPKEDPEIRQRFEDLLAYCPNRKYGCLHQSLIRHMKSHLEKCNVAPTDTNKDEDLSEMSAKINIMKMENSENNKAVVAKIKLEQKAEVEEEVTPIEMSLTRAELEREIERLKKSEKMRERAISTFLKKLSDIKEESEEKMRELQTAQDLKLAQALRALTSKDLSAREEENKRMEEGFSLIDLQNVKSENEKLADEIFRLKYKLRKYENAASYEMDAEGYVPIA